MNIESLPKWAQETLKDRDRTIKRLQEELASVRRQQSQSRISVRLNMSDAFYLPEHARINIAFSTRCGDSVDIAFDGENTLRIYQDNMRVEPHSTNCIYIRSSL